MAKKKKKKAKKSVVEKSKITEVVKSKKSAAEEYTLSAALRSTKKTESTLQDLLKGVSSGEGFYRRQKEEKQIQPQLSHETRKKEIIDEYLMESVPISEKSTFKDKKRQILIEKEKPKEPTEIEVKVIKKEQIIKEKPVEPPIKPSDETIAKPLSEAPAKPSKEPVVEPLTEVPVKPLKKAPTPSPPKKDSIYAKLTIFFEEYLNSYSEQYNQWEAMISNILAILRKMRKITQKNAEELVKNISQSYVKVQKGLDLFKLKRSEIEKIAEVDVQGMSSEFKKVLGMLELQVKEYQFKRISDAYFRIA